MNKFIITILGLILSGNLLSQSTRFIYQATITPDSTNIDSKKTELAYLDTDGKKSVFYSEKAMKRDSVMERMRTTKNFDRSQFQDLRSNIQYVIEKDIANQNVVYQSRIGRDQYSYNETPNFQWKILPETVKIGEYQTQKAETKFGERIWYAWFTQQVPLQEGPYKFSGLPGLIVKIQDAKGDYAFDLMQTKKIAEIQRPRSRGQYINIPKAKYIDLENKFRKDPESFMNQDQGRGFGGGNRGGFQPDPQQMKEMRERMLKEIKDNNNPIELK